MYEVKDIRQGKLQYSDSAHNDFEMHMSLFQPFWDLQEYCVAELPDSKHYLFRRNKLNIGISNSGRVRPQKKDGYLQAGDSLVSSLDDKANALA